MIASMFALFSLCSIKKKTDKITRITANAPMTIHNVVSFLLFTVAFSSIISMIKINIFFRTKIGIITHNRFRQSCFLQKLVFAFF